MFVSFCTILFPVRAQLLDISQAAEVWVWPVSLAVFPQQESVEAHLTHPRVLLHLDHLKDSMLQTCILSLQLFSSNLLDRCLAWKYSRFFRSRL